MRGRYFRLQVLAWARIGWGGEQREDPAMNHQATFDECRAAAKIAETMREQAATMAIDSPLRALALRSAIRWGRVAETQPRLSLVEPPSPQESMPGPALVAMPQPSPASP